MAIKKKKSRKVKRATGSKAKAKAPVMKKLKRPAKSRVGKVSIGKGRKAARKTSAKSQVRGRKY